MATGRASRELAGEVQGGLEVLTFAGAASGDGLLVAAARSRADLTALCDELAAGAGPEAAAASAMRSAAATGSARDERRALEELARLSNDLVDLQRELARKNAELEGIARERAQLVSTAAHDLRSPLGAISIWSWRRPHSTA